MLSGLLLTATLVMKLFPETPLARALHRILVAGPLERIASMGRRHLIFAMVALAMLLAGTELILLLGSTDIALMMAWDVSLYVDAAIAAWTLAAVSRGKGAWLLMRSRVARLARRSPRPRAPRRHAATRTNANDADAGDGPPARVALAA
jgi:hypothetical protein